MNFIILGSIEQEETFAVGNGIRELARLRKIYGNGRWRKRKGLAWIRFDYGGTRRVELHWYEAVGVGRKEFKIKQFVD